MTRILIAAACLFLALLDASPVRAEPATAAERQVFEQIIRDQMDAFRAGDDTRAFSHASPDLQVVFGSPDRFMRMVRTGYQPVYKPSSVTFGEVLDSRNGPTQQVHVIGPDGNAWTALYTMERQDDGSWRISGCTLVRSNDAGA